MAAALVRLLARQLDRPPDLGLAALAAAGRAFRTAHEHERAAGDHDDHREQDHQADEGEHDVEVYANAGADALPMLETEIKCRQPPPISPIAKSASRRSAGRCRTRPASTYSGTRSVASSTWARPSR